VCVICPASLILVDLVQSKPSNYDIPYQAILSSFLSFPTFKAEVNVYLSVTKHSHTLCSSLSVRKFYTYTKEPIILQFYTFMLSVV